eukprot:1185262-Prorocentrum_minimum.AAC.1
MATEPSPAQAAQRAISACYGYILSPLLRLVTATGIFSLPFCDWYPLRTAWGHPQTTTLREGRMKFFRCAHLPANKVPGHAGEHVATDLERAVHACRHHLGMTLPESCDPHGVILLWDHRVVQRIHSWFILPGLFPVGIVPAHARQIYHLCNICPPPEIPLNNVECNMEVTSNGVHISRQGVAGQKIEGRE